MSKTLAGPQPTLLKVLVKARHLTVQETIDLLEARARRMGEGSFALSERQLRRWMAGQVEAIAGTRPANVRVVEAEFKCSIEALLAPDEQGPQCQRPMSVAEHVRPLRTGEFIGWVAEHSAFSYEDAYATAAEGVEQLEALSPITRATADHSRARVGRVQLADAVAAYYGEPVGLYRVRAGKSIISLSVLVDERWTGLGSRLGGEGECCAFAGTSDRLTIRLSDTQARAALDRLAAAEVAGTVMVNNPLYRLLNLDVGGRLAAEFAITDFAAYALTADLLESETRTLLRDGWRDPRREPTPMRDAWLPTLNAGLDFGKRASVGGPVCLMAIADGDHYNLLIQERSNKVLNVTGTLAVIPKAFHQPTVDPFGETAISATVERELEEELFGRTNLEHLSFESSRRAAPMHPLSASEPMRWLHDHPDAWRMECTGFGINMLSGNYEFACLVAVHDESWWASYGHLLEANWEAQRLHRYSSLDADGLHRLILDDRWSNEALFALVEGLRRLAVLEPDRVRLPALELMS